MSIESEDLMLELQRVAGLTRRHRRGCAHSIQAAEAGTAPGHEDDCHHHHHHHHHHHGDCARSGEKGHGHGSRKCRGGSGRHGQNRILAVLTMQDGTSQKDLAYLLGIRPQSLTQALETLEVEGHVVRKQDEQDKRTRRVFLTESGRQRAAQAAENRRQYADSALSMLTDEEKDQLAAILGKIASAIDAQRMPNDAQG